MLDYLSIQASSIPYEHVFSLASKTEPTFTPTEALQILKFIYKKEWLHFTHFLTPTPKHTMLNNTVDLGDLFNVDKEAEIEATDHMLSTCSLDNSDKEYT